MHIFMDFVSPSVVLNNSVIKADRMTCIKLLTGVAVENVN